MAGMPALPPLNMSGSMSPKSGATGAPMNQGSFADFNVQFGGIGGTGTVSMVGWAAMALVAVGVVVVFKRKAS